MSANKKHLSRSVFGSEFGCGCGKTKIPDVIQPQPIHPQVVQLSNRGSDSTSSSLNVGSVSATSSLSDMSLLWFDSEHGPATTEVEVTPRSGSPSSMSAVGGSMAVVKGSDDLFRDFQDSMLWMIREKGIYSRYGLKDLLRCFLEQFRWFMEVESHVRPFNSRHIWPLP